MGVHEWFQSGLATVMVLIVLSGQSGTAIDNLRVAYRWDHLEYNWPDEKMRQSFPHYIAENNNPLGIGVTDDRIFITVPRWRKGVAATLNYINLNDTSESPLLNPYPSWEAHKYGGDRVPELISVCRIQADRCGRLWVVDAGVENILEDIERKGLPTLSVYDLSNDQVLRKYVIPGLNLNETHLTNVAVEDASCEDTFAYFADSTGSTLVVYSWFHNTSWTVKHHYFHPEPLGGSFNLPGLPIQWWDGIIGLGLAPRPDGFSTLYFNSISSTYQFSVDTKVLRDRKLASQSLSSAFHRFKVLGSRGRNGQSLSCFFDPTTGILFQAILLGNYIACWKPGTEYNLENLARVYENNVTMAMPSEIKIDPQGNIWVLSNRMGTYFFGHLDPDDYNYHILTGTVEEAVRGTSCAEEKPELSGLDPSATL